MGEPEYLNFLQEVNYFISGGNKYYNFSKWKNDENGKLFIVGLSGSGKTTLGQDLAKKYKAEYIKLDEIDRNWRNELAEKLNKPKRSGEINLIVERKVNNFIEEILNSKGKKVVEGIHILYCDYNYFKHQSLIIMGTSILISTIRAYRRNFEKFHDRASRVQILSDLYYNQKDFIKKLHSFEKFMEGK